MTKEQLKARFLELAKRSDESKRANRESAVLREWYEGRQTAFETAAEYVDLLN